MDAEVKRLARAGSAMHWLALAAGGLAGVFALGLIPRLAGGNLAPAPLFVTLGLILASAVVATVAWSRAAARHVEPDAAPWGGPSAGLAVAARSSQPPDVGAG